MKESIITIATGIFAVIIDEKSLMPVGSMLAACAFCIWVGMQYKGIKDEIQLSKKRYHMLIQIISELKCAKGKILPKECLIELEREDDETESCKRED